MVVATGYAFDPMEPTMTRPKKWGQTPFFILARCARTTEAPRIRGDTEGTSARHGSGPRKDQLRGFAGTMPQVGQARTDRVRPYTTRPPKTTSAYSSNPLKAADFGQRIHFMRLAPNPCDHRPFFRALFCVGGSRFRVGGGMPATKWLTMVCGATHELARTDAAHPIATRAWRRRHSPRRFRGEKRFRVHTVSWPQVACGRSELAVY